jgi:hypothetical protein
MYVPASPTLELYSMSHGRDTCHPQRGRLGSTHGFSRSAKRSPTSLSARPSATRAGFWTRGSALSTFRQDMGDDTEQGPPSKRRASMAYWWVGAEGLKAGPNTREQLGDLLRRD